MVKKPKQSVIKELLEIVIISGIRPSEILRLTLDQYNELKKYYIKENRNIEQSEINWYSIIEKGLKTSPYTAENRLMLMAMSASLRLGAFLTGKL